MERMRTKALEVVQSVDKKYYVVDLAKGYVDKTAYGDEAAASKAKEEAAARMKKNGKYGAEKVMPWEKDKKKK